MELSIGIFILFFISLQSALRNDQERWQIDYQFLAYSFGSDSTSGRDRATVIQMCAQFDDGVVHLCKQEVAVVVRHINHAFDLIWIAALTKS